MTDPTFTEAKGIFESRTVWGALIAIACTGAGAALHVTISQADQNQILNLVMDLIGVAGSALAIYGRISATHKIGAKL